MRIDGGDLQKVKGIINKVGKKLAKKKPVRKKTVKKYATTEKGSIKE